MTMTATPRTVEATGNGIATSFSFGTARIFAATDLIVTIDSVVKTLGADYTVVNGNVVFSVAPADGTAVKIRSAIPLTRDTDFTAAGRSTPAQLDADLDRLMAIQQETAEAVALVAPTLDAAIVAKNAAAADRVQTGLDAVATAADRVQTGLDAVATSADRVQTGLDAVATAADRVQTGLDAVATAADRAAAEVAADAATMDGFLTKAAMDAAAGTYTEGKTVRVTNDPTAAYNGIWIKGASTFSQSSYDRVALTETDIKLLKGGQLSESVPNKLPDLWRDGPFFRTTGTATKVVRQGHECLYLSTTGAYRTIQIPVSDFVSGYFDASILCVEKNAVANAVLIIRQNKVDGTETTTPTARQTVTLPSTAITAPTLYELKNIAINPDAAYIEFWMGAGSSGAFPYFALPLLADATGWTGYRPKAVRPRVTSLESRATAVEARATAVEARATVLEETPYRPNLILDPFFETLTDWGGPAETSLVDLDGIPTVKIEGTGSRYIYWTVQRSAIPADVVSFFAIAAQQDTTGPGRLLVRQMDVTNTEIVAAREETTIPFATAKPMEVRVEGVAIDPDCVSIQFWLDKQTSGTTAIYFQLPCAVAAATLDGFRPPAYQIKGESGISSGSTLYVATDGDDTAAGSSSTPLATIARAQSLLGGRGTIVLRGGDYTETISLAAAKSLKIVPYPQERVRIIKGTALSGITKTGGYTKVYQASLAASPNKHIFEHETPEGEISAAERQSLQRGRSHRLPSTRLWPVASIAAIDAVSEPSWYWSGGVIYFSASDGGDATANTYYAPSGTSELSGLYGGTSATEIEVQGIEVWYGYRGLNFASCGSYKATDCFAFGSYGDGIIGDYSTGTEIRCESAANGNDGFNSHHQTTTPEATTRNGVYLRIDNWAHDNYDDGNSIHERCQETIIGGLYEYNGDRGIVPASGGHTTCRGVMTRKNGQNTVGGVITGEGFGIINSTLAGEGGVGTQMECYDCVSDQDNYGFGSHAVGGKITAINCRTISAVIAAYSAQTSGEMTLMDCKDSGSGTVKLTATGGVITVSNGSAVV